MGFTYILLQCLTGHFGPGTTETLTRTSGTISLLLVILNLSLGSLAALYGTHPAWLRLLSKERRAIGLSAFAFLLIHIAGYVGEIGGSSIYAWDQLFRSDFLIYGGVAATVMAFMAATSNDFSVRVLKKQWKTLHRLVHLAVFFIVAHLALVEKRNIWLMGTYFVPLGIMQVIRVFWPRYQPAR